MEILIELLFELLFEGTFEISKNKKISKLIRYPLIALIVLFFALIIFGMLFIGLTVANNNILLGLFIIIISLVLLVLSIMKFKKIYMEKKENIDTNGKTVD